MRANTLIRASVLSSTGLCSRWPEIRSASASSVQPRPRTLEGKKSPLTNLYPPFPGIGNQNPFRCTFETDPLARRIIPVRDIHRIVALPKQSDAVRAAVELFTEQAI